ncbi:ATP-binding cassette domain-containing protein [Streptomyces alkaliphilus]|uniref:ATP-binding cassette domain-containing protein n=1 Tax=Streptomyces alkaliphilus TaxID=1472722 RepID=A0A7W3T9H8_9ACTN|nr:ATP-binding cassette domain-containing protein [Streptomyces alkaliphilus]MBB0242751.1 ATP-binding cassette domain-containing protein [Streptomyces alkaliphilus]
MSLRATDLAYRVPGGHQLFTGLDLRVEAGQVVGLTGESGCGKSTLARILAGHLPPTTGTVLTDGYPVNAPGPRPVQLVQQHPEKAVNPRWTMRSVVAEAHDPDPALCERLGIRAEWYGRRPAELSGGELQRFCLLRALGPRTRYLIADEMTAMFDTLTQAELFAVVRDIVTERSIGLLVISHDIPLLDRLCDEIVAMPEQASAVSP